MTHHPIQPLVLDEQGVLRFKKNKIVEFLLDNGGIDLNQIGRGDFSREDREQFAQLIGYSYSGAGDLDYTSSEVLDTAISMYENCKSEAEARAEVLHSQLENARRSMRGGVAELFGMHPDDLPQ
ncbi:hypothetical protein [Sulfitobacter sp. R18_1]|uniref:hypothetical protein n=1 Tax=Sulfitobacter sp. R18_1 TaxID=2821104 RepID=UPI001ADACB36|nr:hypothetical protein [Sulfitobacter sp. R18_1]MBO9428126.1 hypothetical protein [Sulfitobacter sp. R18_1]